MSTGRYLKASTPERKTVYKHRAVMERKLGRTLGRFELVHHKNEDRSDNRLDNLELTTPKEHSRHHMLIHPISKACVLCGTTFTPLPSHRPRDLTCSWACRKLACSVGRLKRPIDYTAVFSAVINGHLSERAIARNMDVPRSTVRRVRKWGSDLCAMATAYAKTRFG